VREILKKANCKAGGFKVPLLLAIEANTQLEVGIGQRALLLYKRQRAMSCCTSQWTEATPSVNTSIGSIVTTTEKGSRTSGVYGSLSRCWVCAESLPQEPNEGPRLMTDEGGR
jgi:hypothetical protein